MPSPARRPALILALLLALGCALVGTAPALADGALALGGSPFAQTVLPDVEAAATIVKPAAETSTVGVAITPLAVTGTHMVTLTAKELPEGLTLEKASETEWKIVGTPTTVKAATTVTLEVKNTEGKGEATTFSWTVTEAPATVVKPAAQTSTAGVAITPLAVTGTHMVTLTAKELPEGLTLEKVSETEWKILGTPTVVKAATTVTLEVKDAEAKGEATTFEWTVTEAGATIVKPGAQTSTAGTAITPLIVTGTHMATLTAEELPEGLTLEKVSETEWNILGTPTVVKAATTVTLEAKNGEGKGEATTFEWTVTAPTPPAPQAPSATGTLAVSPAPVFSAVHATCGGLTWSASTVTTQWLLNGTAITGADAASYTPPRGDDGQQLSCRETATGSDGASTSATSAPRTIHELPPQPSWPISPATEHCAEAVCMEDGAGTGSISASYGEGRGWWTARQVRCASAPWTSMAGDSSTPAVSAFAEAQTITVQLQRMTASGPVVLASRRLSSLAGERDLLDGTAVVSPFPGTILQSYGSQTFQAGEAWTKRFPASLGQPDWLAPGGGLLAYEVTGVTGVARSFQLTYTLAATERGARLRCVVTAQDGPSATSTEASFSSREYSVSDGAACAPRLLAHGGPQPAVVQVGNGTCLFSAAGPASLGPGFEGLLPKAGRVAVAVACSLPGGCPGELALRSSGPHPAATQIAAAKIKVGKGAIKVVELSLNAAGKRLLKAAGSAGLSTTVRLTTAHTVRALGTLRLLAG